MKLIALLIPFLVIGLAIGVTFPGHTVKGDIIMDGTKIINLGSPVNDTDVSTKGYVSSANSSMKDYVDASNTSMKSYVDDSNSSMKDYVDASNSSMKVYVDLSDLSLTNSISSNKQSDYVNQTAINSSKLSLSGGTMAGNIAMDGSYKLTGLTTGSSSGDSVEYSQAVLNSGKSGGQTVYGGTGSGDNLILLSTSDSTIGKVVIGARTGFDIGSMHAWSAIPHSIEGVDTSVAFGFDTDVHVNSNAYYNAGWKYATADYASNYYQYKGEHVFRVAVSGSVDDSISWLDAMKIANSGYVKLGGGSDATVGLELLDSTTAGDILAHEYDTHGGTQLAGTYAYFPSVGTPSATSSGAAKIYVKSGIPYYRNETGEYALSGGDVTLSGGDFYGVASSTADDIITFADTDGKTAKDSCKKLSDLVYRDGTQALTGDLPAGGYKVTGAANGTASGEYVTYLQSATKLARLGVTVGPASDDVSYDYETDGSSDDVQWNAAIDFQEAHEGGPVFIANGNYDFDANVCIPSHVSVYGMTNPVADGQWGNTDFDVSKKQAARIIVHSDKTAILPITMEAASELSNVQFYYPDQATNAAPTAYAASITLVYDGSRNPTRARITNVDFGNCYYAIDATEYHGGMTVLDCVGWPLYRGIVEDDNWDVSYWSRIHFNPSFAGSPGATLSGWVYAHGIAYEVMHSDDSEMEDCFSFGYNIGIYAHGNSGLHVNGGTIDAAYTPLVIENCQYVQYTNGLMFGYDWVNSTYPATILATVSGSNHTTITSSTLLGGRAGIALFSGYSNVIGGNTVKFNAAASATGVGVYITDTTSTINGNVFTAYTSTSNGFQLAGADNCALNGNTFYNCASGSSLDSNTDGATCGLNVLKSSGSITNSATNSQVSLNAVT